MFMISWAVEPSFSSTVTSINDPLCTVLAANLQEKNRRETFYPEREKEETAYVPKSFKVILS